MGKNFQEIEILRVCCALNHVMRVLGSQNTVQSCYYVTL